MPLAWSWMVAFLRRSDTRRNHILAVGLGLFGLLAPAGFAATLIASWYASGSFGNLLAGWLGGY